MSALTEQTTDAGDLVRVRRSGDFRRISRPRWRQVAPLALFLAVAASVIGWHMYKYPYLSPIDENAQFDYIRILPDVPSGVDTLSQDSLRLTACRGYPPDLFDQGLAQWDWPPCRSDHFDPNAFPGGGKSTAGSTAPFYYFVTAALTRPIAYVVDIPLITLVRAAGILWLTGLMAVGYLIARRVGAARLGAAAAAVMVGTSSDVVSSAATAGPDIATGVMGGLVILASLTYDGSRRTAGLLLLAVALASVTKLTVVTAVGAAMIILLLRALVRRAGPMKLRALPALGLAGLTGVVFVVLSLAWFARPKGDAAAEVPAGAPAVVPWLDIKAQLFFNFLSPNAGNFNAPFLDGVVNTRIEQLMVGLLMFGVLAGAMALRQNLKVSFLAWAIAVMAVTGPILLTLLNLYANNWYFALPPRYGYGLMAGFIGLAGWAFKGPALARALAVLAGVSFLSVFL